MVLSDAQKLVIDKARNDEVILYEDRVLGDMVYDMGKSGKSTDEILVWIWKNEYGAKYGLLPVAVNAFLSKRGLTAEVRKAIRTVPILSRVDAGIDKRIDMGSEKTLLFMKEKLDKDFGKVGDTINQTVNKQITQINIQVVSSDEEEVYDVEPELITS